MSETSGAKITYRFNKPGDTVFGPFKIRMPHVQTKSRRKKNNEHYKSDDMKFSRLIAAQRNLTRRTSTSASVGSSSHPPR